METEVLYLVFQFCIPKEMMREWVGAFRENHHLPQQVHGNENAYLDACSLYQGNEKFQLEVDQYLNYKSRNVKELMQVIPCACIPKFFLKYIREDKQKAGFLIWSLTKGTREIYEQYLPSFIKLMFVDRVDTLYKKVV